MANDFTPEDVQLEILPRNVISRLRKDLGRTVVVGEQNIHYVKVGNGPHNVILLPSLLSSLYDDFYLQLDNLNRDLLTIYSMDLPGQGYARDTDRKYPIDFHDKDAEIVADFIKALGISQARVIGFCHGGTVGIILAADYPQLVEKLIVFGSKAQFDLADLKITEDLRLMDTWPKISRSNVAEIYGEEHGQHLYNGYVDAIGTICRENGGDICMKKLANVKCPTLILHGKKDLWMSDHHVDQLMDNITNIRYIEKAEGRHRLNVNFPEWFNQQVEEFIINS